ncbi:Nrap protein [Ascobolus immersus RN42]|uniref:U3 small nucleolar RNA-associated protein 22 n=1 Tax=Ascobolus immersus RN42 TaxID=1160509 RepID=A0A3N4HH59_ASCIM|nr:Nrap protein [Ascobolus immersus RN42]
MHATKRRRTDGTSPTPVAAPSATSVTDSSNIAPTNVAPKADADVVVRNGPSTAPAKRPSGKSELEADDIVRMYESKSNLFRLETEELLSEVKVNYEKRMGPVDKFLHRLKTAIEEIPEKAAVPVLDAEKDFKAQKIHIPFPDPRPPRDAKYKLGYEKPTYLTVVGGYAIKNMIKQADRNEVDVAVAMPSSLFQEKDYLNYRYFYKRAYYLACIASGLQASKDLAVKIAYELLDGDVLRPVLVLSPSGNGGEYDFSASKCVVRILLGVQGDVFPPKKLYPSKNCVRSSTAGTEDKAKAEDLPATAFYNSSLIADTSVFSYLKFLHSAATSAKAFKDANILASVWLRQRGFGSTIAKGGFGALEWAQVQALLLKGGGPKGQALLSPGYSSYQMFKAVLQYIANNDLAASPAVIGDSDYKPTKSDSPVLFDSAHGLNVLFKMSAWAYKMLRHEASITVSVLNKSAFDQFDNIFVHRVDQPCQRFDALFHLPLPEQEDLSTFAENDLTYPDKVLVFARKVYRTLARGLTDRSRRISLQLPSSRSWELKSKGPGKSTSHLVIGLHLDQEKANRAVDHGPAADNKKEAAVFRKFWGEKSELRRFKDGSILESLVWDIKDSRNPVINQIVRYLIGKHFKQEIADSLSFIGDSEYMQLLPKPHPTGSNVTGIFQPAMSGFETLVKDLRALEGIPLHIRHISPADPALRYASVDVPLAAAGSGDLMQPADVILQFETSSRWPDDLAAIQKTKLAFLLKIAELMEEQAEESISARVGLENPGHPIQNAGYLDLAYASGPVYRIRIFHEREEVLLSRKLKDKTASTAVREEYALSLSALNRNFVQTPRLTQSIQTACHRHPLLSPTIRLLKRWFRAHLLDSHHIEDEFIELLAVRTFLQPYPYSTPASLMSGFMRTLSFLATWDWRSEPLIVDFSSEMKSSTVESITRVFESHRKQDPGFNKVTIFATTNFDDSIGTYWTTGLEKVVAGRMTMVARAASEAVKTMALENHSALIATLFTPATRDFHFILHLSPKALPTDRPASKAKPKKEEKQYKNLLPTPESEAEQVEKKLPLLGFSPARLLLADLTRVYSPNSALFFLDEVRYGVITGLWSPGMMGGRDGWKVGVGFSSFPVGTGEKSKKKKDEDAMDEDEEEVESVKLVGNRAAVLAEIARLGGDLVERIEVLQ